MGRRGAGRIVTQVGVAIGGLAIGVGAIALRSHHTAAYKPGTPSIAAFPFDTSMPSVASTVPVTVSPLATEPADAAGAIGAFLAPLADGRPEMAYPLLDQASRARYSSPAAWGRAQVDRAQPVTFEVGASRPSLDVAGAVEVDVASTHHPSLDSIRGLVPARSQSVWLVRREDAAWRVSADPVSFRPVLPPEAAATDIVQAWVSRLAACDSPGAAALQVRPNLYGPAGLVQAPCQKKGPWIATAPVGLDKAPDPSVFLAAFGPDVGIGPAGSSEGARDQLPGCSCPSRRQLAGHRSGSGSVVTLQR